MKIYLSKLATDYGRAETFLCSEAGKDGLRKMTGRLLSGARCAWCYDEDVGFWRREREPIPHPKDWPYQGFIMPFPEVDARSEIQPEHACLIITNYPIEKENAKVDWCVLALLFESEDLFRFYVFEPVTVASSGKQKGRR